MSKRRQEAKAALDRAVARWQEAKTRAQTLLDNKMELQQQILDWDGRSRLGRDREAQARADELRAAEKAAARQALQALEAVGPLTQALQAALEAYVVLLAEAERLRVVAEYRRLVSGG